MNWAKKKKKKSKYVKYADLQLQDAAEEKDLMHNSKSHSYPDNEPLCKPKVR